MDKVNRYGWEVNTGEALQTKHVPVEKLNVDTSYQREKLSERIILGIASSFKWSAFRTLLVARRSNGELYVVDGQHRLDAAKRRGIKSVPCSIFDSTGPEEEAQAFYTCSMRVTRIPAANQYRALLAAKDPEILAISKMLSGIGLGVSKNGSDNPNLINFPAEVIRTFRVDPAMTEWALLLQRSMVGSDDYMGNEIHKGLFYVLQKTSESSLTITNDMALKVYQAGGKPVLKNSINAIHAKSGNAGKDIATCGAGVWAVIKKVNRLRANLGSAS